MAQVTLRKVVKMYDEVQAVRGIDLDIVDKEFSQNSEHGLHHFHSHVLKALGRI